MTVTEAPRFLGALAPDEAGAREARVAGLEFLDEDSAPGQGICGGVVP